MYYIYVTPFFPSPDNWRGAYCYDFVRALQKSLTTNDQRLTTKVLVFKPGSGPDYEIGGVKVYRFAAKEMPSNVFPFIFARYNARSFVRKIVSVIGREAIANAKIIVHGNTADFAIYPWAIKKLNPQCLTLLHHHDLASFGYAAGRFRNNKFYRLFQTPILRTWHKRMDCHVFISGACKRHFEADAGFVPRHAIILHNGVDTSVFNTNDQRLTTNNSRLPTNDSRLTTNDFFTIGCVGNFAWMKDQHVLIKAAAKLKNVKLIFIGSGPNLEPCRKLAEALGVDVEFRREVPHAQLADFYRSLDLSVLPSFFEGFGCVLTESWCCGTPFIACEGQGVDDLIPTADRGKWLFKAHDHADLAAKIAAYRAHRWEQRLTGPVDIETLVGGFVKQVAPLLEGGAS